MKTSEKVDIRLVYLAIHHIIKYRGNFLYEGEFSENSNEINEKIDEIIEFLEDKYQITLNENNKNENNQEIINILKQKNMSKTNKKEKLLNLFSFDKTDKPVIVNMINAILGYQTDINKIFGTDIEKSKISFAQEIENEEEIKNELREDENIYECISSIYSWFILQDILKGKTYISEAIIEKYKKYGEDLKLLKRIYKTYFKEEYADMFRNIKENNYVAYNGKNSGERCKKCKPEDFFAKLKKKINELPDECKEKETIIKQIEDNDFLVKINVTDNGAIPHQLHKQELEKILENQSKYYKTLKENKDKIIDLFTFKIPYYVGPLSKEKGKWSWVVRKEEGQIRPWNFGDIVDEDETAEKFIRKMTNKCTYLLNEDVIPKQSILYSKFCVLNELNNIRINNHHLSKSDKTDIIENIFKKQKKITVKHIKEHYKKKGIETVTISGLTDNTNFMSNMETYIDMEKILGKVDGTDIDMCEELIYWITIFEEKKILKRKIQEKYKNLTNKQVEELCKKRYTGWSRLSKKLLTNIKAYDGDNIIEKLEKTNMNFMQIINEEKFGFGKKLEELMPKKEGNIKYKDVEEIPTSPANKRAIWQTICVVKEIVRTLKCEPQKIYIEFARQEQYDKKMTQKRAKQIMEKYEQIENQINYLKDYDSNVYKQLKKQQNDKTLTEKMYLYYVQNGKCLYSGKTLNLDNLSQYEVDHIIPRSYIKDDSIDNKALVLKEENQRKTDNLLLSNSIINKQTAWWQSLLNSNLITQSKYNRLTRRKMFETDQDREKFVQRQLVETRQITKYVTNLLKNEYEDAKIYSLRAELTHSFRDKYRIYKNRNVNNYHHAQDAYIISTIGNLLDKKWGGNKSEFKYGEYVKKYMQDEKTPEEKYGMIIGFIRKNVDIEEVKKVVNYKDCYISRMLEENTGEFYNQTLYSPNDSKNKPVIPLKIGRKAEKYGGYSGENKAYSVIFGYTNKKGEEEYKLIGIPIKIAYDIKEKRTNLEEYIKDKELQDIEYRNFKIIRNHILKNQQYLDENGEDMRFCSDSEVRPDKELIVNYKINDYIYLMNLEENKLDDKQKEKIYNCYEEVFDYLLEKMKDEYKSLNKQMKKIYEKKEIFMNLKPSDKKAVINLIIDMMEKRYVNLKILGLSSAEGRMSNKTFNTDKLLKMTFIDKSVTGMYERRFKINGMENNSSK